ncbi:hypothetical protein EVAR_103437_1 [Eumeta japonica]|uniref:DNA helicase Pif1-like 2B domain-containing protein n=1 Tax=Eumeta variegata TaxID=151549 RepID=A0A4C1SZI9_EUMVA|nr:hypothetical protein EVAR_103437_1 [Eumeta japonica]
MEDEESTSYPVEFLESLSAPGLPAHKINLKVGTHNTPRNLKLCNGTRLKVTNLQQNLIEAEILTGCGIENKASQRELTFPRRLYKMALDGYYARRRRDTIVHDRPSSFVFGDNRSSRIFGRRLYAKGVDGPFRRICAIAIIVVVIVQPSARS